MAAKKKLLKIVRSAWYITRPTTLTALRLSSTLTHSSLRFLNYILLIVKCVLPLAESSLDSFPTKTKKKNFFSSYSKFILIGWPKICCVHIYIYIYLRKNVECRSNICISVKHYLQYTYKIIRIIIRYIRTFFTMFKTVVDEIEFILRFENWSQVIHINITLHKIK